MFIFGQAWRECDHRIIQYNVEAADNAKYLGAIEKTSHTIYLEVGSRNLLELLITVSKLLITVSKQGLSVQISAWGDPKIFSTLHTPTFFYYC